MENADSPPSASRQPFSGERTGHSRRRLARIAWLLGALYALSQLAVTLISEAMRYSLMQNLFVYTHQTQLNEALDLLGVFLVPLVIVLLCLVAERDTRSERPSSPSLRQVAVVGCVFLAVGAFILFGQTAILQSLQPTTEVHFTDLLVFRGAQLLLVSVESGLLLGVALAFVWRRFSLSVGGRWVGETLIASLIAAVTFGFYSQIPQALLWGQMALEEQLLGFTRCNTVASVGAGCFSYQLSVLIGGGVLPLLLATPLGILLGSLFASPVRARDQGIEASATPADENDANADTQPTARRRSAFWRRAGVYIAIFLLGALAGACAICGYLLDFFQQVGGPGAVGVVALMALLLGPMVAVTLLGAARIWLGRLRMQRVAARSMFVVALVALCLLPLALGFVPGWQVLRALDILEPGMSVAEFSLGLALALLFVTIPPTSASLPRRPRTPPGLAVGAWFGFAAPFLVVASNAIGTLATHSLTCTGFGGCILGGAMLYYVSQTSLGVVVFSLPCLVFGVTVGRAVLRGGSITTTA